ncbi:MAG: sugar transferase [Vicingaceae bacterium]
MKRAFDFFFSFLGILILLPIFLVISMAVLLGSGMPVFYLQERVGKDGKLFNLIKFRTMKAGSNDKSLLTIGDKDQRITSEGYVLRKLKLDELPQLFNVLAGEMSLVGPRPEVSKYVEQYTEEQRAVLEVKPGVTDIASIIYINESELLAKSKNPENTYVKKIMPEKIRLNLEYLEKRNVFTDLAIILKTFTSIIKKSRT